MVAESARGRHARLGEARPPRGRGAPTRRGFEAPPPEGVRGAPTQKAVRGAPTQKGWFEAPPTQKGVRGAPTRRGFEAPRGGGTARPPRRWFEARPPERSRPTQKAVGRVRRTRRAPRAGYLAALAASTQAAKTSAAKLALRSGAQSSSRSPPLTPSTKRNSWTYRSPSRVTYRGVAPTTASHARARSPRAPATRWPRSAR